jgi:dienelactone hydrolase
MPQIRIAPILIGMLCAGSAAHSQIVFVDPVFDVNVTQNVLYGHAQVGHGSPGGVQMVSMHLDILQPVGPSVPSLLPAAIFINGGGFLSPNPPGVHPWMHDLARRGYVTLNIDYRVVDDLPPPEIDTLTSDFDPALALAGQEMIPERSNAFAAQINDTKRAIAWLQDHAASLHVDPNRLMLVGGSSGARVALATGIAESPDDVAGVLSLLGTIPGNEYLVGPGDPAIVLFAGISDPIVPVQDAIALADAAYAEDVPLLLFMGSGGHDGSPFFLGLGTGESMYEQSLLFMYNQLNLGGIPGGGTVVPELSTLTFVTIAGVGLTGVALHRRYRRGSS